MRWQRFFGRRKWQTERDAELDDYLAAETRDNIARGMSPADARAAAERKLGNRTAIREDIYRMNTLGFLESLWHDVRFGARMLRKNPAFLAAAILSLGLGIGANATIFSFVNALLFRSPSAKAQSDLLELAQVNRKASGLEGFVALSYPAFEFYRDTNQVFSGVAAFDGEMRPTSWSHAGGGQLIQGQLVSSNFFSVLGIPPQIGRDFLAEEGRVTAMDFVAILSHAFWQRSMGADPSLVGRKMTLNGVPFIVVGIAPPDFRGVILGNEPDFWTPLPATRALVHDRSFLESWGTSWLFGVGRIKSGVSPAQARVNLQVLGARLQQTQPKNQKDLDADVFPLQLVPAPVRGYVDAFGGLLMMVVGLVLLIACANTANLVMAQAASRGRETALRAALGAGRARLIRQALTENLLLALAGCMLGLLLASAGVPLLLGLRPPSLPLRIGVSIDWRVVVFSVILALAAGALLGLIPALRASRLDLVTSLREGPGSGSHRSRLRSALVVAQLSTCVLLLVSAALCGRSLINAQSIDPGFDPRNTALATIDPGSLGYSPDRISSLYKELLQHVGALPGVTHVGLTSYLPLGAGSRDEEVDIDGQPSSPEHPLIVDTMYVGVDFLQAMRISLLRGRDFTESDASATPPPVLINEAMAKRFWPGQDPLGKRIGTVDGKTSVIVGIVATGKQHLLTERARSVLYRFLGDAPKATLVVRVLGDPRVMLEPLQRAIQAVDPNVVVTDLETLQQYMKLPLYPARTAGVLLAGCGVLALVLAVTGIYGVTSYSVGQRTREFGIRTALGASHGAVLRLVIRQGLFLIVVGVGIGVAAAFGLTRALSGLLYGISPTDFTTFLAVPALMAGVTLAACYVPARRAARLDPMVALREE